ncbi:MAG: hypothetical protein HY561_10335 [Gemmatimonadetes bacterium]|nr:hypothetical protein [Gemmatimonadota bacterium]
MHERHRALLELQEQDREIEGAEKRLAGFIPELETLEAPVQALERETETLRTRLVEMRQEVRRLEHAAEEKRERLRRYQERLERVRNAREEAAARTEFDLVRRAVEADEQEALQLMDQGTRSDLKLDELEKQLVKARSDMEPQREQLLVARAQLEGELAVLRDRRQNHVLRLDPAAARLYERVRAGRTRNVLAALTQDGACGNCFSLVPLQQRAEIRREESLVRCEACGVILYVS